MYVKLYKLSAAYITAALYAVWCFIFSGLNQGSVTQGTLIFVSWIGILQLIIYLSIWYKITGSVFSLFTMFLAFFAVFNFGQCLLWPFVTDFKRSFIEYPNVFGRVKADQIHILKAQLMYLICFSTLNAGAIMAYKPAAPNLAQQVASDSEIEENYRLLFTASKLLSFVVIPVSLYVVFVNFTNRLVYGYAALYYGAAAGTFGPVFSIISSLFLPCLLGLLIGSHYKKNVRIFAYSIFAVYSAVSLLSGDRGEWILKLAILFYADHLLYKKKDAKKLILTAIAGYFFLYFMNAVVGLRNKGLSAAALLEAFSLKNSPIVDLLAEFGHSMGVNIVLLRSKVEFPYGNSILMSILTAPTTSIARLLGMKYVQIHTWFPFEYLHITWGTDFTLIGEAILNFGEYLTPLVIFVLGYILMNIVKLAEAQMNRPLALCLSLSIWALILKWPRTTLWIILNSCCSMILLVGVYMICKSLIHREKRL